MLYFSSPCFSGLLFYIKPLFYLHVQPFPCCLDKMKSAEVPQTQITDRVKEARQAKSKGCVHKAAEGIGTRNSSEVDTTSSSGRTHGGA